MRSFEKVIEYSPRSTIGTTLSILADRKLCAGSTLYFEPRGPQISEVSFKRTAGVTAEFLKTSSFTSLSAAETDINITSISLLLVISRIASKWSGKDLDRLGLSGT